MLVNLLLVLVLGLLILAMAAITNKRFSHNLGLIFAHVTPEISLKAIPNESCIELEISSWPFPHLCVALVLWPGFWGLKWSTIKTQHGYSIVCEFGPLGFVFEVFSLNLLKQKEAYEAATALLQEKIDGFLKANGLTPEQGLN